MYVVREIMHCKPGKVTAMRDKFKALAAVMKKEGMKEFRLMTDVSGPDFWTLIAETEVETLDGFMAMSDRVMASEEARKAMAGYHELVASGSREIYQLEG